MTMRQLLVFITISIVLAACAPMPDRAEALPAQPIPTATQPECQPSLAQPSKNGFPEIKATMKSAGEIWALLFFDKAQAKKEEKIVWGVKGTGTNIYIR